MEVIIIAIVAVVAVLALIGGMASIYKQVPPNKALIVYGWGGTNIITGGGRLVIPVFQGCQQLSLELMSFDVAPEQDFYTSQGVAVSVEAVTQIKVKNDLESIRTAAEQFLAKSPEDRENLIKLVMEGHLRGIVGQLTVEDIVKKPEEVASLVLKNVTEDLTKMGLSIVSFTIKNVADEQEYIKNMGRPDVARIKLAAEIAEAEAAREIASKKAEAMRQAAESQAAADQARVFAQAASETKQAEAVRDLNLKKAEYDAEVNHKKAVAEKAFEISSNQAEQQAVAEKVKIAQVEKTELIRLQELEVARRELELQSTMIKQSDAEKRRIEIMAEAEASRQIREAQGRAEAAKAEAEAARLRGQAEADVAKARGQAEADVARARGQAEADVVAAKGAAEARALQVRAEAYAQYNQAAILDRVLDSLPAIAQSFADSLAKVDKITIVSTGDGKSAGASALTGEVAKMIAQVPTVVESLTGIDVGELLRKVPGNEGTPKAQAQSIPVESEPV